MPDPTPSLAAHFGWIDWTIIAAYLVFTTWLGARLSGSQATIRDFFLGGRKLPWYAVAGSIISTEISAVTFVSVPSIVYGTGGNFRYLQFGLIGSLLARLIVAYVLVPAYYQREIYSPYDYMGNRLGEGVKRVASALFALGGVLGQAARLYLTAVVLELVLPLSWLDSAQRLTGLESLDVSIALMGIVAIVWTLLGGMSTVIWTDVISFGVFVLGAIVAIAAVVSQLDGGIGEMFRVGAEHGKFRLLNFSTDPTEVFTVWAAAFAVTLSNVGAFGTDQLLAQRIFCCRDAKEASKAMVWSCAGVIVTATVMLVGVGLFAFYRAHPLEGDALALYQAKSDRILPIFVLQEVPAGLRGMIVAGILAAAISGLDSIFVALAQTVMSTIYQPLRAKKLAAIGRDLSAPEEERRSVRISRILVVVFGVLLSVVAMAMEAVHRHYASILDLALALASYSLGGLLAAFLLAFLPLKRDGSGLVWSVPLSVLAVFAVAWPEQGGSDPRTWPMRTLLVAGGALVGFFLCCARRGATGEKSSGLPFAVRALILISGMLGVLALNRYLWFDRGGVHVPLAWPWHALIGCGFALGFGWLLGDSRAAAANADPGRVDVPAQPV